MNNFSKEITENDGTKETIIATSEDNYQVRINGGYTISNHQQVKENGLIRKFKKSIFGSDIGIKSNGFSSIAGLALIVTITIVLMLYLFWRF